MHEHITQKIDALIGEAMRAERVPGVAVAVTEGGEITYARGHGVMNVEMKIEDLTDAILDVVLTDHSR
jgi:CubicO group peptidase (beta-lactamase class C family)